MVVGAAAASERHHVISPAERDDAEAEEANTTAILNGKEAEGVVATGRFLAASAASEDLQEDVVRRIKRDTGRIKRGRIKRDTDVTRT